MTRRRDPGQTRKGPAAKPKATQIAAPPRERVYTLDVFLVGGPVTEPFAKKNPVVSRTIEIRGDQTLEALHLTIFRAFDREEEHMYEFQVGGRGPMDRRARRYTLSAAIEDPLTGERAAAGDVRRTTVGSLGLRIGQAFGYWFDFGDDWRHQINVVGVGKRAAGARYPKVTKRVGESPPQYVDWDEEGE